MLADLDGDGIVEVVLVDRAGRILVRKGRSDGSLESVVYVNGGADHPAARAVAVLREGARSQLVALDMNGGISVYQRAPLSNDPRGRWTRLANAASAGAWRSSSE